MFRTLVLLAAVTFTLTGPTATARTWYIKADGTGDAPTIQDGIDSATAGDLVLVGPGTFNSTIQVQVDGQPATVNAYISKSLVLQSESGPSVTKIDGAASDICILIVGAGNTAEVSGFEITIAPQMIGCVLLEQRGAQRSSQGTGPDKIAIRCDGSSSTIHDNIIHDAYVGIRLNSAPATITANIFENVAVGVDGVESDALVTTNTAMTSFGVAFSFMNSSPQIQHNTIKGSNMAYSCRGIECVASGKPTISDNTLEAITDEGIWCNGVSPTITGNSGPLAIS